MANKIEQVIGDIEEYIDGCKMQAFSNTKIIVDRPQIEQFLDELREYTPEEVKKYQRMLNNRDKILADAKKKAAEVEDKAQAYADHMVSENNITRLAHEKAAEILKDAREQADAILENARAEASMVREGALGYTNELLNHLQQIITGTLEDVAARSTALVDTLNDHRNIVLQNQKELNEANAAVTDAAKNDAVFFNTEITYDDFDAED